MKESKLLEFLKDKKGRELFNTLGTKITFKFHRPVIHKALDGQKVIVFRLNKPIERVNASQGIRYGGNRGEPLYPFATDVMEIRILESVFNANDKGFKWDEDLQIGKYKGKLLLDLDKRCDVWLTDIPFNVIAVFKRRKGI